MRNESDKSSKVDSRTVIVILFLLSMLVYTCNNLIIHPKKSFEEEGSVPDDLFDRH